MRRLVTLCTLFIALFCAPAASAADFTWAGGNGNWSLGARWTGGTAPSGTVGTLSFPAAACSPGCPASTDDVAGLTASNVVVRTPTGQAWGLYGSAAAPLTLTGGLDVVASTNTPTGLGLPIVLGADNSWTLDGDVFAGQGFGVTGNHSLAVGIGYQGLLTLDKGRAVEVGPMTITGTAMTLSGQVLYGGQVVLEPGSSLNGVSGEPVSITNARLQSDAGGTVAVGPLTAKNADVVVFGTLNASSLTLDADSSLGIDLGGAPAGTAPVTSTGPVDLGGAALGLSKISDAAALCSAPKGSELTLISTTGALNGVFAGLPDGATFEAGCNPYTAPARVDYRISYHRTGPTKTVTATAVSNYAFTGTGSDQRWSVASNWNESRLPSAGESFSRLSMPYGVCAPPGGCTNDLLGLSMSGVQFSSTQNDIVLKGNAITLGARGVVFPPNVNTRLELPITLGADQTWTAPGDAFSGTGIAAGGVTGPFALTIAAFDSPSLPTPSTGAVALEADNEVAAAAVTGNTVQGMFAAPPLSLTLRSGAKLNASNGNPVSVTHAKLASQDGSVGALHTEGAIVDVGVGTGPLGSLAATSAVFDAATTVRFAMSASSAAATLGTYGQLTSAGAVDLGGATLAFGNFNREAVYSGTQAACVPPVRSVGTVYTLISAAGPLTGTFANAPEGAVLQECFDAGEGNTYEIHYTAHAVTATVKSAAPQAGGGPGPGTQPGYDQAQVKAGLAHVRLPATSNGKAATFAIPADAFPAGTKLTVALRAAASALIASKSKPVGSRTVTTQAGKATSITVKLSRAARKRLRKRRRLKVTVTVTAKAPSGATATRSKTLTLKKRRPHERRPRPATRVGSSARRVTPSLR